MPYINHTICNITVPCLWNYLENINIIFYGTKYFCHSLKTRYNYYDCHGHYLLILSETLTIVLCKQFNFKLGAVFLSMRVSYFKLYLYSLGKMDCVSILLFEVLLNYT